MRSWIHLAAIVVILDVGEICIAASNFIDETILISPRQGQSQGQSHCINAEKKLDECSQRLIMFGQRSAHYPSNILELENDFCPNFRTANQCIKKYSTCYRPFQNQIINWVLKSTVKMGYKRCKNETEKAKFVQLSNGCLTMAKSPINTCMDRYIANLERIARQGPGLAERLLEGDNMIQLSCCANRQFKQCVMTEAQKTCNTSNLGFLRRFNSVSSLRQAQRGQSRAHSEMMNSMKNTIDCMALTGPEYICNKIDDDYCERHYEGQYEGGRPLHRSIVPAMIKIYTS